MARTAFRATVTNTTPFTIPAGKTAIFKAFSGVVKIGEVTVNGVVICQVKAGGAQPDAGPITANAGDVLSTANVSPADGGSLYTVVGFLYDN